MGAQPSPHLQKSSRSSKSDVGIGWPPPHPLKGGVFGYPKSVDRVG